MEFQVGANVGGYDILDIISSSKSEVVYRVRNLQAKRIEVMRVLPLSVAGDQDRTERFLREMRVHAKLSHPNILEFYGATELERRLVMTTEAIDGITLAERLKLGPLPWKEAVGLIQQALAALGHAHAQGVVHRDVKPQNMIVTPEGVLKLADFGLAKATTSPQVTQVGVVVGTLQYISPEQVRGTAKVDARSDLYSLGLVLYEAVAGKTPFDYKSQFELMVAQVNEVPKPPSALNRELPAQLDAVILEAVAKNPDERFQTADDFSAALGRVKALIEQPEHAAVASVASKPPVAERKMDSVPAAAAASAAVPPRVDSEPPAAAAQAAESAPAVSPDPELAPLPPPVVIAEPAAVQVAAASEAPELRAVEIPPPGVAVEIPSVSVSAPVNGQAALLAAIEVSEQALSAAVPSPAAAIPAAEVAPASEAPAAVNGQSALLSAVINSEMAASPALVEEIAAAAVGTATAVTPVNGQSALLAAVEAFEEAFAETIDAASHAAPVATPPAVNGESKCVALAPAADAPAAIAIPAFEIPGAAAAAISPAVNGHSAVDAVAAGSENPLPKPNGAAAAAVAGEAATLATPPPVPASAAPVPSAPEPPGLKSPGPAQPVETTDVLSEGEPVSQEESRRWDAGLLYLFAATVIMLVAAALTALLQTPQ